MQITINGRNIEAAEGSTILQTARREGIEIPTLCYLEGVNDIGSCRLCVVELSGSEELVPACNTKVKEGMVILTHSERVKAARRMVLNLLLSEHYGDCFSCEKNGDCELQKYCIEYGVETTEFTGARKEKNFKKKDAHPFLSYDPDRCIECQRCVKTCSHVTGRGAIWLGKTGMFSIIDAPFGEDWKNTLCESCGNCAQACPTGALTVKRRKAYRAWEVEKVRTTCPHCATGCQMDLVVKNGKIVDAVGAVFGVAYGVFGDVGLDLPQLQVIAGIEHAAVGVAPAAHQVVPAFLCRGNEHAGAVKVLGQKGLRNLRAKVAQVHGQGVAASLFYVL